MKIIKYITEEEKDKLYSNWKYAGYFTRFVRKKWELLITKQSKEILNIEDESITIREEVKSKLYERQVEPLQRALNLGGGILSLPMRFGKTAISIGFAINDLNARSFMFVDPQKLDDFKNMAIDTFGLNENEIIIIHKEQAGKNFEENLNKFRDGNYKIALATVNMARDLITQNIESFSTVDNIIFDEFHSFISNTKNVTFQSLIKVKNEYDKIKFLLLSATPIGYKNSINLLELSKLFDKNMYPSPWGNIFFEKYNSYNKDKRRELLTENVEFFKMWLSYIMLDFEVDYNPYENLFPLKVKLEPNEKLYDWLNDHLKNNSANKLKTIIICYEVENIKNLSESLKKDGIDNFFVNGSVNYDNRNKIYDEFNNGDLNVIILQQNISRGISLSKADETIIYDTNNSLRDLFQAVGRMIPTEEHSNECKIVRVPIAHDKENEFVRSTQKERDFRTLDPNGINYPIIYDAKTSYYFVIVESGSDKNLYEKIVSYLKKDSSSPSYEFIQKNKLWKDKKTAKQLGEYLNDWINKLSKTGAENITIFSIGDMDDGTVHDQKGINRVDEVFFPDELLGVKINKKNFEIEDVLTELGIAPYNDEILNFLMSLKKDNIEDYLISTGFDLGTNPEVDYDIAVDRMKRAFKHLSKIFSNIHDEFDIFDEADSLSKFKNNLEIKGNGPYHIYTKVIKFQNYFKDYLLRLVKKEDLEGVASNFEKAIQERFRQN